MPFIPPGPVGRIYSAKDTAVLPQHQELVYFDPEDPPGTLQRFTMYTGELLVHFDSGDTGDHDLTFRYPVLGTFWSSGGGTTHIGIIPINVEIVQFRSAIAYAAVTSSQLGDTPVWADVGKVSADLFKIELDSRDFINAVVLSGMLTARNSQLTAISYRVSVLERMNRQPQARSPILVGDVLTTAPWTGEYVAPSGDLGSLLKPGIPQDFLEVA
jgi:hypothetical protein